MTQPDTIEIRRLRVRCRIGVTAEERGTPQDLWLTVSLVPAQGFEGLNDRIDHTVDYQAVAGELCALAAAKPRRLIETLALDSARMLLRNHPLQHVAVTVEKHILPHTECVAVHLQRSRQALG